jgi:hypothetical protein
VLFWGEVQVWRHQRLIPQPYRFAKLPNQRFFEVALGGYQHAEFDEAVSKTIFERILHFAREYRVREFQTDSEYAQKKARRGYKKIYVR